MLSSFYNKTSNFISVVGEISIISICYTSKQASTEILIDKMMIFMTNVRCYWLLLALFCFMLSLKLSKSFHIVTNNGVYNKRIVHNTNNIIDDSRRRIIITSPITTTTSNNVAAFCLNMVSNNDDDDVNENNKGIDVSLDSRLYKVRISRAVGIEWGTDLSFSFVYVRNIEPDGAAAMSGLVKIGDQLCELMIPGQDIDNPCYNLIGESFDNVMSIFANLNRNVIDIDLVFFRGTKKELKDLCNNSTGETSSDEIETITVTVIENKGATNEQLKILKAPIGINIRELLISNNINVYQSITRWTNCKGKQLCGTCIVNVTAGQINTNRKSMDETSTLRENPDTYRLSCISFAYGDITVETFPPIKASQWTR